MKSCGGSTRPPVSGARTKQRYWPSGDQRGCESLGPAVIWRDSPVAVETVQIAVSYPSLRELTFTRTKATRDPSGATCGSAIQTKLNRSRSVILRFCAWAGTTKNEIVITTNSRRIRIKFPFEQGWHWRRIFYSMSAD